MVTLSFGKEDTDMKKIFAFTIAALSLLAVSCNKEAAPEAARMVSKTFTVSAPQDTKTELSGTKTVLWSADDEINVIAASSGNQYTFTITEGAGQASAKCSGEIAEADAEETTFYALYPNVPVRASETASSTDYSISAGNLIIDKPVTSLKGVKDGFPTGQAYLTAVSDAEGNFAFKHGAAYFKLTMPEEGIDSIRIQVSGSARLSGRPIYKVSDGSTANVTGAKNFVDFVPDGGTFEKGATYYIPVLTKQSNCGSLTVSFFNTEDASASVTTESLSGKKLTSGLIYDLGSPAISFDPVIVADNVSIDASATSGSIAYEISNYKGTGTMSASLKESSDWLTLGEVVEDAVYFTCTANTGSLRSAVVVLTFTYAGSKTVSKEVEIYQGAASGGPIGITYNLYVNDEKEVVQTKDGEACDYFTVTGTSILDCSASGYFTVDGFTINGKTYSHAKKIDGSNNVEFTTSSSANTTIRFYAAKRQSDKAGTIKFKLSDGSKTLVSDDMTLGTLYDSGEISLDKGKAYKFDKTGEVGLFFIEVVETF